MLVLKILQEPIFEIFEQNSIIKILKTLEELEEN